MMENIKKSFVGVFGVLIAMVIIFGGATGAKAITTNVNRFQPSIDLTREKELLVTWIEPNTAGDVYAQKFNSDGAKVWASNIKAGPAVGIAETPIIVQAPAAANDTYANVFWSSQTDFKLTFQTINPNGSLRLPAYGISETKLNSSVSVRNPDASNSPSVHPFAPSYVVWEDNRGANIYMQKVSFGASYPEFQWNSNIKVNSLYNNQTTPKVAADKDGNVYVVWANAWKGSFVQSPTDGGIFMRKFSSSGDALFASEIAISNEGSNPSIAINLSTDTPAVYVAWQDIVSSTATERVYDVFVKKFNIDGTSAWAQAHKVDTIKVLGNKSAPLPKVVVNQNDNSNGSPVFVAWYNNETGRINIQGYRQDVTGEIICQFGSGCLGTSYPAINSPSLNINSGFVNNVEFDFLQGQNETDRDSFLYLAWSDKLTDNYDIFTQKFNASTGSSVWKKQIGDTVIATPAITVLSPNGGEQWEAGKAYNITWNSTGYDKVRINIDCEGYITGAIMNVPSGATGGSYGFTVPANLTTQNQCKAQVSENVSMLLNLN